MERSLLYFDFIKSILNGVEQLPESYKNIDWKSFYQFCSQQSVLGIVFDGIKQYDEELKGLIDKRLLFNWYGDSERIKELNKLVNKRTIELTHLMADAGFHSCILKGQGNTLMYPNPYARIPGDIDSWIDADREQIENYVRSQYPNVANTEQDIQFPVFRDVKVELHYKPQLMVRTKYKKRLFEFFEDQKKNQFSNMVTLPACDSDICIPTPEFNVIFQMSHLMAHFFKEGIGLRQFVDYYYVLKSAKTSGDVEKEFDYLGMLKFARGVMWVEKECLGVQEKYLLVEPYEKTGRIILEEIVKGGNFGQHDQRYSARKYGYLARGITDIYRLVRLTPYFPADSLSMIWRKFESRKWKFR